MKNDARVSKDNSGFKEAAFPKGRKGIFSGVNENPAPFLTGVGAIVPQLLFSLHFTELF